MNAIVVEQKPVASQSLWTFRKEIADYMEQGWRIVPGTVVIQLSQTNDSLDERYFAVLEK